MHCWDIARYFRKWQKEHHLSGTEFFCVPTCVCVSACLFIHLSIQSLGCLPTCVSVCLSVLKLIFFCQVVPIQQILQVDLLTGSRDAAFSVVKQLKCLAFSVFSRCRKSLQLNINAKSLTGFGPAARHEALLRQREVNINLQIYSNRQMLPLSGYRSTDQWEFIILQFCVKRGNEESKNFYTQPDFTRELCTYSIYVKFSVTTFLLQFQGFYHVQIC